VKQTLAAQLQQAHPERRKLLTSGCSGPSDACIGADYGRVHAIPVAARSRER